LNIPTFAITDTNTDPTQVDFAIPANDDATKSISIIVETMIKAIEEGLSERKVDKEMEKEKEAEEAAEIEKGDTVEMSIGDDEPLKEEGSTGPAKSRPRRGAATPRKK
jgi:small subunit ribosomal protein S2